VTPVFSINAQFTTVIPIKHIKSAAVLAGKERIFAKIKAKQSMV
jgi:hypothetical protein